MSALLFDPEKNDVAHLAALHQSAFAKAWDKRAISDLLAGPGVFAFFAADGFVLARAAGGEAEILTLAIAPAARRQGLGRALVKAAAGKAADLGARAMFLEVGKDNQPALALYSSLGFDKVGSRKAYYDGADAWVLKAVLPLAGDFA